MRTLERDVKVARRTARPAGIVVAGVAVLAAVVLALRSNINGDVTYALGGLETAGRGGVSVWDIFIARPVVYKLLIAALDAGRHLLVGDSSLTTAHLVIRLETYALIVGVTAVLFLGVRRVAGLPVAAGIAAATGLALIVSPPWHFLEPDWVAPLCGVLAVGGALLPRRLWLGVLLGGFATMLVVAVKLATFPVALLTLLIIAVLRPAPGGVDDAVGGRPRRPLVPGDQAFPALGVDLAARPGQPGAQLADPPRHPPDRPAPAVRLVRRRRRAQPARGGRAGRRGPR